MSRTRRVLWFIALVGPIVVVVVRKRMAVPEPRTAPSWPPFEPEVPIPTPSAAPEPVTEATDTADAPVDEQVEPAARLEDGDAAATAQAWVPPVDGACPQTHPIKANAHSRIYHVPGSRFYDRTRPERCYADAAAAEADGYRAAKGSTAGREPQEDAT